MRLAIQYVLWAAGLGMQVLVIREFLRGFYKRFPVLFAYAITLFLTTIIEVSVYTAASSGARFWVRSWRLYYWIDDAILQALIFSVVISLIHQAMGRTATRTAMGRWLIAGGVLVFALSFLVHRGPLYKLSAWMTLISRDLSFSAVVLDLLLWSTLIASRKKDIQLLMLSGGLGIQFTGAAIGQSVRQLAQGAMGRSYAMALAGSILVVLSNLACLYIWWQALRRPVAVPARDRAAT